LVSVESLVGCSGRQRVLGTITQLEEGQYYLEDLTGIVKADFSQTVCAEAIAEYSILTKYSVLQQQANKCGGFITENAVVIAEGTIVDNTFVVELVSFSQAETKQETSDAFPDVDFFGQLPPRRLFVCVCPYQFLQRA